MIHLVTRDNRHLYERQLQQFGALHDRGSDPYDDDDAIHLVGLDPHGDVGVGVQLRSTVRGSIIADRFPDLVVSDRSLLCRGDTLEASRLVLGCFDHEDRRPYGKLALAMLEAAQLMGASRIVGVVHLAQWPMLDGIGWRITPLSAPIPGRRGTRIAFEAGTDTEDLRAMRDAWAIDRALIYLDDEVAGGLPIELLGERAEVWSRLTAAKRHGRLIGRRLADAPAGMRRTAPCDADRDAIEEALQILDTVIDQDMLARSDNDLRQQGAIMLLAVAQSRLRAHLAQADEAPSPAEIGAPPRRSTH